MREHYPAIRERQTNLARWHRQRVREYWRHRATVIITQWAVTVMLIIVISAAITIWAQK